jgi:hypothetical protein
MIYTIANLTTTAGTPKQFATTRTICNWVQVTAVGTNSGANVFVGGVDPTSASTKSNTKVLASTNTGIQVAKGTTLLIPGISAVPYIDLQDLWFDVATSNDAISVTYAIR